MDKSNHFKESLRAGALIGMKKKSRYGYLSPEIRSVVMWLDEKDLEDSKTAAKIF